MPAITLTGLIHAQVVASNLLIRLATQMEWESDRNPLLDEVAGRLCTVAIDNPAGVRAEQACVLLAVLANTLANTIAYMRLYEASAETMPLRLEQVLPPVCVRTACCVASDEAFGKCCGIDMPESALCCDDAAEV